MESLRRRDTQRQKHKISLFQRYIQEARWPTCWTLKKQQMTNVLKKKKYNWIMKQRLHLRKIERGDLQWQKPHTHIRATSPISLMLTWENSESSTLEQHVNQHEKECSHDVLHIDNHRAENISRWQSHFSSPCTVLHIQENVDFLLHEQNYSLELTQKFTWLINTNENLQSNIKQKLWEKDCTTKRVVYSNFMEWSRVVCTPMPRNSYHQPLCHNFPRWDISVTCPSSKFFLWRDVPITHTSAKSFHKNLSLLPRFNGLRTKWWIEIEKLWL